MAGWSYFYNIDLVSLCMWVAHIFYFSCFIPQIITNYRNKSGTGVSELFLLGYLNAYFFVVVYIFCMNLPLVYKIMAPLQGLAAFVLILQRLYYDKHPKRKQVLALYGTNLAGFAVMLPYAYANPLPVGWLFGWINFVLFALNQLPQVVKIHRQKSVTGFNLLFVIFNGCAALFETVAAYIAQLPIQTILSGVRGIIYSIIFCWQFMKYK